MKERLISYTYGGVNIETFRIYTAGATKNLKPHESYRWRKEAKDQLEKTMTPFKVKVFIPEEYFNYTSFVPDNDKQCMKHFMWKNSNSDLVLVNLNNTNLSVGTGMEIQNAVNHNIPIIGFGNTEIYPWIAENCDMIFENMQTALEYIKNYYLN